MSRSPLNLTDLGQRLLSLFFFFYRTPEKDQHITWNDKKVFFTMTFFFKILWFTYYVDLHLTEKKGSLILHRIYTITGHITGTTSVRCTTMPYRQLPAHVEMYTNNARYGYVCPWMNGQLNGPLFCLPYFFMFYSDGVTKHPVTSKITCCHRANTWNSGWHWTSF